MSPTGDHAAIWVRGVAKRFTGRRGVVVDALQGIDLDVATNE